MTRTLLSVMAPFALGMGLVLAGTAVAADDVKLLRYSVTDIKLYDAKGKYVRTVAIKDMPPAPVKVVDTGVYGKLIGITLDGQVVYLSGNEAQTTADPCPTGTTYANIAGDRRNGGENAGAGDGNIRCVKQ